MAEEGVQPERLEEVRRSWNRSRWTVGTLSLSRGQMSFELVCVLGFLFIFLITPFDSPLWSIQNHAFIFSLFPDLPTRTAVGVLLANGLLNAALLRPVYKLKMPIDSRWVMAWRRKSWPIPCWVRSK